MLELRNISFRVGNTALLDRVSLEVHPGEVLAIVGANGAGKTTLTNILSGKKTPQTGDVMLDGSSIHSYAPSALARRRAVLPQFSNLSFAFTVFEVVLLGRTPHQTSATVDAEICLEAMRVTGVIHLASREYPTLSGGEQQRVHLARALAQIWHPNGDGDRYLFLDEPTASLDLAHQHHVLHIARDCAKLGLGIMAVLHDLNLAAEHADRIAIMRQGTIAALGSPDDVLTSENIEAAFDISVMVTQHPHAACPLVVAVPEEDIDLRLAREEQALNETIQQLLNE